MMTPSQVAQLAGVSPQLVAYWIKAWGIDWRRAWLRRQTSIWRHEAAAIQGKVIRPPTKRQLRKIADRALKQWNKRHGKASAASTGQPGAAGKGRSSSQPAA